MKMKALIAVLFQLMIVLSIYGQSSTAQSINKIKVITDHPSWILQGNIYEVNVRQYSEEGTFNVFAKHLDRLKAMGVQTIWFMPINPISKVDRKGSLGSYYAVSDYTAINPEFGTINDFKQIVKSIHDKGMKVIIDWVPNHTGGDHRWLIQQPDFFVKDSTGKAKMAVDWADTRQLDYKNTVMQDSMIAAMKYWITNADIDGFRCDVAWNVPASFWEKCMVQLKPIKSLFMLAEADNAYLPESGFHAVYPWHMFNVMGKIARGERNALSIDSVKSKRDAMYPKQTIQMYFTSNHDENSWNKADYGTFPGSVHEPFAVFTQTMANSVPLIYSGQEEPILRPLQFFDKDPMVFKEYKREAFYKTLLSLRKRNPALSATASFRKISVGDEKCVYAYIRESGKNKVLVILNFSATKQIITIREKGLLGNVYNVFKNKKESITPTAWSLETWGYAVYEYTSK